MGVQSYRQDPAVVPSKERKGDINGIAQEAAEL